MNYDEQEKMAKFTLIFISDIVVPTDTIIVMGIYDSNMASSTPTFSLWVNSKGKTRISK